MLSILKALIGTRNDRELKRLRKIADIVNGLEEKMKVLSDGELQAQTNKFKELVNQGTKLEDILPEAFATVREASVRVLKMRHFDVQVMGGVVLFEGNIAEMKTGEGKTLCSTLPLYLHGLSGKGAHLVTPNDYLASRDARDMGVLLKWLGLSVGCIVSDIDEDVRKQAYQCDITYGTNNEFAFDYLRDNMKFDLSNYVQRGHNFCIVDEVDSILIDEARTPLLISGPVEGGSNLYKVTNRLVPELVKGVDFTVEEKTKSAMLTEDGIIKIQKRLNIENLFDVKHSEFLHHLNQSLRAHHLFNKDVDYVVKDDRIVIVDEFTGRLKEGSRWSDGLHQAIECKENVIVKAENQTLASTTYQNYFRLYKKLAGMTGTAETEADEFSKIYNLGVTVIPTNVQMIRIDEPDVIYKTEEAKYRAVANMIKDAYSRSQPVLVGTISIEKSELLSKLLTKEKIPHEVLNAKQHAREAEIISKAGQPKSVTIATNMAGRGTDIKLTPETVAAGGLLIVGTERHEARRIDNQLRGRSGRQGDPGRSKFFLSLEDDLMRIFGSERIKSIMNTLGMSEDEPIEHRMISNAIAKAQKKVETHHFEIRKHLLEYDNVMNEQRTVIYRLRKEILADQENMELVHQMVEDVSTSMANSLVVEKRSNPDSWEWEKINSVFQHLFNTKENLTPNMCTETYNGQLDACLTGEAKKILEAKFKQFDSNQVRMALREILLSVFDSAWKEHLRSMDGMKEGISLRAYAQKDPLNEYKREAFNLFEAMRMHIKNAVVKNIFHLHIYTEAEIEEIKRKQEEALEAQLKSHKDAQIAKEKGIPQGAEKTIKRPQTKVGRNDLCPCGSGKKFKHCHGA